MIEVGEDIRANDLVYAWFSPLSESLNRLKRPKEGEWRICEWRKGEWLKLDSTDGGYSVIFTKELIEGWFGGVRKIPRKMQ